MGFNPEYAPLTSEERDMMNRASTTQAERTRLYARDLLATSAAYLAASDAVGLRKDAASYLAGESARLRREGMAHLDRADLLDAKPVHTRGGKADGPWAYGMTHDMDCPACVASGSSYTASPRSESYWSS